MILNIKINMLLKIKTKTRYTKFIKMMTDLIIIKNFSIKKKIEKQIIKIKLIIIIILIKKMLKIIIKDKIIVKKIIHIIIKKQNMVNIILGKITLT